MSDTLSPTLVDRLYKCAGIPISESDRLMSDAADEIERLRMAEAEAMALVLSHEGHIERLHAFARDVLETWRDGGIEGDDLQEIAVKHGLLLPETRTAPCSAEGCNCAEYYADDEWAEGITCYRRAPCLRERLGEKK